VSITLEPFDTTEKNFATVAEWLNDPEVVQYSEHRHLTHSSITQINYHREMIANGSAYFAICDPDMIGTISARMDQPNKVAQVGILIGDKTKWGKDYGFQAWKAMGDWLFEGGIRKIEAGCMATNYGMISVFLKYGMLFEAYIPGHFLVGEEEVAEVRYGKFNEAI